MIVVLYSIRNYGGYNMKSSSVVGNMFLGKSSSKYKDFTLSMFFKKSGSQLVRHYDKDGNVEKAIFFPGAGLPKFHRIFSPSGAVISVEKIPGKCNPASDVYESITYTKAADGNIIVTTKAKDKPAKPY